MLPCGSIRVPACAPIDEVAATVRVAEDAGFVAAWIRHAAPVARVRLHDSGTTIPSYLAAGASSTASASCRSSARRSGRPVPICRTPSDGKTPSPGWTASCPTVTHNGTSRNFVSSGRRSTSPPKLEQRGRLGVSEVRHYDAYSLPFELIEDIGDVIRGARNANKEVSS